MRIIFKFLNFLDCCWTVKTVKVAQDLSNLKNMSGAASPWKIQQSQPTVGGSAESETVPISLEDIMSEELASKLQGEEEAEAAKVLFPESHGKILA